MEYILYGIIIAVLIVIAVFFFKYKKSDKSIMTPQITPSMTPRVTPNNLYIALRTTGVIEGFDPYPYPSLSPFPSLSPEEEFTKRLCNGSLKMLFGNDANSGIDKIYENVMGKKISTNPINCNGKTMDEVRIYIQSTIMILINEMLNVVLKNNDIKKRNNDLVSIWVIVQYGIASIVIPGQFQLTVQGDQDNMIKTIEFKAFNSNAPIGKQEISATPSLIISGADNYPTNPSTNGLSEMKNLAIPLVDQAEINALRTNINPKMTVDQLAMCILYKISKTGDMNIFK